MTVVFIKSECPKHPGRYTMGEPCDLCIKEDFRRRLKEIFARPLAEGADPGVR